MSSSVSTDVIIIGAGPVGLFSIFECGMLRLKCHVVDALDRPGGQCTALYPEKPIYDIPGFPKIAAQDLIDRLEAQGGPFHPVFHWNQQAVSLEKKDELHWVLTTSQNLKIQAKAIVIAAGGGAFGPNRPPLEDLERFEGKSVFYSVKSRQAFKGKRVVIAGGGDSAVDWALALQETATRVSVVHRRPKFRAAPENEAQLKALAETGKIDLVIPYQLHRLEGSSDGHLTAVVVKSLGGEEKTIAADVLLPFFGLSMDLGPLAQWGLTLEQQHISVVHETCQTNLPGVYAIGDIATYPGKQKLILCGFAEAAQVAHAIRARLFPGEQFHFAYSTTSGLPEIV